MRVPDQTAGRRIRSCVLASAPYTPDFNVEALGRHAQLKLITCVYFARSGTPSQVRTSNIDVWVEGVACFSVLTLVHLFIVCDIIRKYFRGLCSACCFLVSDLQPQFFLKHAFFSPAPVSLQGCGMDISARTRNSLQGLSFLLLTASDSIPSRVRHEHFGSGRLSRRSSRRITSLQQGRSGRLGRSSSRTIKLGTLCWVCPRLL